jgi:hypothetical protein
MASFAIRGILFVGAALLMKLSRHYEDSWIILPVLLLPAALACALYLLALSRVDRMALDHRENLFAQLGR